MNKPRNEASAISRISRPGTFSFGRKSDSSQNRAVAPRARRVKNTIGGTAPELATSLQKTMLNPKIA